MYIQNLGQVYTFDIKNWQIMNYEREYANVCFVCCFQRFFFVLHKTFGKTLSWFFFLSSYSELNYVAFLRMLQCYFHIQFGRVGKILDKQYRTEAVNTFTACRVRKLNIT